jgi:type II secretory pathway pseudopilin PulG
MIFTSMAPKNIGHIEHSDHSFTLIELMIVALIVAVLAAVSVPLMGGSIDRAITSEAETGCATIRAALRVNYVETRDWNSSPGNSDDINGAIGTVTNPAGTGVQKGGVPGLLETDLNGTWFSDGCYGINFEAGEINGTPYEFFIIADGTAVDNPSAKAETVQDKALAVRMYSNGIIKRYRNYTGGLDGTGVDF